MRSADRAGPAGAIASTDTWQGKVIFVASREWMLIAGLAATIIAVIQVCEKCAISTAGHGCTDTVGLVELGLGIAFYCANSLRRTGRL